MVAMGCKYLRICHLNNCATGVPPRTSVLRAKITSSRHGVDKVMNYFRFIAAKPRVDGARSACASSKS